MSAGQHALRNKTYDDAVAQHTTGITEVEAAQTQTLAAAASGEARPVEARAQRPSCQADGSQDKTPRANDNEKPASLDAVLPPAESRARMLAELIAEADDFTEISLASPVHRSAAARTPSGDLGNAPTDTDDVGEAGDDGGLGLFQGTPLDQGSTAALYRSLAMAHETIEQLKDALAQARAASADLTVAAGTERSAAAAERKAHAAALGQREAALGEAERVRHANRERILQLEGAHADAAGVFLFTVTF